MVFQWSFSHSPAAFSHSSSVVPANFISHALVVMPVASHSTSVLLVSEYARFITPVSSYKTRVPD